MRFLFLAILFICSMPTFSQTPASLENLKKSIRAADSYAGFKHANWSFCVRDANSGKKLAEWNVDRALSTASTMKILTTSTALAILGKDHRFETRLEHDGELKDGVLQGNLYIKGSGDPSLGSDRFGSNHSMESVLNEWVNALKAKGIERIEGKVIGDASVFGSQITPRQWGFEDIGNYYGAGACGLVLNENKYRLDFEPDAKVGKPAKVIRTVPGITDLEFINEMKTGAYNSGDNGYIFGTPYSNIRYLRGTVPGGRKIFSIYGAIPDPALFCAQSLHQSLQSCGISVGKNPSSLRLETLNGQSSSSKRTLLHTHQSPPLEEIIYWTNLKSVNIFAECLLNTIGKKQKGKGTTEAGIEAMESYWEARGVDVDGMFWKDGSGLSVGNAATTSGMTAILAKTAKGKDFESLKESLPEAGSSGSLKSFCKGTAAQGKVWAKSGFISGIRGYAGYAETKSGQLLAFSFLVNHYTGSGYGVKQEVQKLMQKMAEMR